MRFRFRRQHTLDRFIVDFYCRVAQLVIEVDGMVHEKPEQMEYDAARQQFLEQRGLHVLRFSNAQVIGETGAVIAAIAAYLSRLESAPGESATDQPPPMMIRGD